MIELSVSGWTRLLVAILAGAVRRGTPIAFVAISEATAQRAGVLNIGVEGMMLLGAMVAVVVEVTTGNLFLAVVAAGLAAAALGSVHALLCVRFDVNQIVSGFAITVLGAGISGYFGRPYVGAKVEGMGVWKVPYLSQLPFLGEIFFDHDPLIYVSFIATLGFWFLMYRTRFGLHVRAVGEDPHSVHAQGGRVRRTRALAVILGGFFAGVGGAHLSIAYTHVWVEHMTAGQGWIALAVIIVAGWDPVRSLLFSWFFGAILVLHPHLQAVGVGVSPYLIATLPYVLSILILTIVTVRYGTKLFGFPSALLKPFKTDES